jgi:Polyferredoxin
MLKKIRLIVSLVLFGLITFYFLDFTGVFGTHSWLQRIQLVPALLSLSFIIIAALFLLTFLFGRIYCSSICPMGIYQDIVGWITRKVAKRKKRFKYTRPKTMLRWGTLVVTVIAFFAGFSVLLGLLDPYSAYGRMVVNVFKPIYIAGNNLFASAFNHFDNYMFYKVDASILSIPSLIIGLLTLLVIGFLASKYGRLWCNTICPVGTLLGLIGRFSLFKVRIDQIKCNHCGVCATKCKASCINSSEQSIDYTRCVDCFDCIGECRQHALSYNLRVKKVDHSTDSSKRNFLIAGAATASVVPKVFADAQAVVANANGLKSDKRKTPITPPGSISRAHFQNKCTSCHLCVSKCPSHVLKPSFMEYGLDGFMQPTVYFEKGFCNFDCTVCSDVCPNGAILPLTKEQKHLTQMGQVVFIMENCIVYRENTSCGACSEHCPTQAISMVPYKGGLTIPNVDTAICVGCGGCEYVCPARPYRAVHIEGDAIQQKAKPFVEKKEKHIKVDNFGF